MTAPKQFAVATIAAALSVALVDSASAVALIWSGPGGELTSAGGQQNPSQPYQPGRQISSSGSAIGSIGLIGPNNVSRGTRAARWKPGLGDIVYQNLGNVDGFGTAFAVNSGDVVVGVSPGENSSVVGGRRAVRWMPGAVGPNALGSLSTNTNGAEDSVAYDINHSGTVVGASRLFVNGSSLGMRAVRWTNVNSPTATAFIPTQLNALPPQPGTGVSESAASYTNASGTVVGWSKKYAADGREIGQRAVRWSATSNNGLELGHIGTRSDGYTLSSVSGLNAGGTAIGSAQAWEGDNELGTRAVKWNAGSTVATQLGHLGTDVNGFTRTFANALNNAGTVVGSAIEFDAAGNFTAYRAVRWDAGQTTATVLGGVGVRQMGTAAGINSTGATVGTVFENFGNFEEGSFHGALWLPGQTQAIDLTARLDAELGAGWTIYEAIGINDTGFITGNGSFDPDGAGPRASYRKLFTMLVPEAGTYGRGDANFDGSVNFADLVLLAQNYNNENAGRAITVADFDLDGFTNFADLVKLAQNYNISANLSSLGESFAADWALARNVAEGLMPEPTLIAGLGAIGLLRRRRR